MAKEKASSGKAKKTTTPRHAGERTASSGEPRRKGGGGARKSMRYVDALLAMEAAEREAFFARKTPAELAGIVETSYSGDLVNVLLDLRKNAVRRIFESVASVRKRALPELVTLYYYKEYLTNPLPLKVTTESGDITNYYAVLGVPRSASEEEIKHAARLLLKAYSDDCFSASFRPVARERAGEIEEAVTQLVTAEKREATDKLLPSINYLYPRREQSWLEAALRVLD